MEIRDYKAERATERKSVLNALKAAGYNASVKHGRGTAHNWLEITLIGNQVQGACAIAQDIAKQSSGRSASAAEHIVVYRDSVWL